jgi:peptide/nickel transport system permease protein
LLRYVAARLVQAAVVLLGVSLFVFILVRLAGDPGSVLLPIDASPEQRDALRREFGLDQPWLVQFLLFVANVLRGDFGVSFVSREPAMDVVLRRLPATLELTLWGMLISVVVGVPLGILAAVRRGRVTDVLVTNGALAGQALPSFWVGVMMILVFSVSLRLLPTSGRGGPEHLVLPVVSLSAFFVPQVLVLVRGGMRDILAEGYIQTARAKGLPRRLVLYRHALRNVLIPVVTMVGLNFGTLLGGAVITESVFAWPGVGLAALQAIHRGDFPVVQASVFVLAVAVIVTNFVVDLLYGWIDPRIRVG